MDYAKTVYDKNKQAEASTCALPGNPHFAGASVFLTQPAARVSGAAAALPESQKVPPAHRHPAGEVRAQEDHPART